MPPTLIYDLIVSVPPYFVTRFSIALFLYGTIFRLIFVKPKLSLPLKTAYLTTTSINLSLTLTLLESEHGKQSALIVAQLIEGTVVNY